MADVAGSEGIVPEKIHPLFLFRKAVRHRLLNFLSLQIIYGTSFGVMNVQQRKTHGAELRQQGYPTTSVESGELREAAPDPPLKQRSRA
jgi:hypothetical protein